MEKARKENAMDTQALTLHLPIPLYDHFKLRAQQRHRSVEAELLDAVVAAAPRSVTGSVERKQPDRPFRLDWVTVEGSAPPEVDPADRDLLYEYLEERT